MNLMSQLSNFKAFLKKAGNFIGHNKVLTILGLVIAFFGLPQIQNLFTDNIIDKPLLCSESTYPIKIKYPESWKLDCTEDAFSGEVAKLIASEDSVQLLIEIREFQKLMSLDEYVSSLRENITKNSNDIEIIDKKATLGNRPAYELLYTFKNRQRKLKRKEVIMLDTGLAYHLIYEAPTYKYNSFKDDVEEMIKSFAIVENVENK